MPVTEEKNQTQEFIQLEEQYGAHNYHPLDVVLDRAQGCWVYDVEGKKYLDCLAAYSAVNQGHCHPKILSALVDQAHKVKGIPDGKAEIIVCANNFHGRTVTIVGFSTDEQYRDGFGPFTPGFEIVPYGDAAALRGAMTPNTCAFLVEPIQGEAGIVIPPAGFLKEAAAICQQNRVLLIADEIQSGLGRTGKLFAYMHEGIRPDAIIVGKALSGGFYPVSAVLASKEVLGVFHPGDHGSTFGGNPLACAVARAALRVLIDEKLPERSAELGGYFLEKLRTLRSPDLKEVRGRGLWIGIELHSPARPYCEALKEEGLLCKETHERVIRIAPPLVITREEIDWAFERIKKVIEKR